MAKGNIGKTYEVIFKVALDELQEQKSFSGNIFWNVKPEGLTVVPDFFLGESIEAPIIGFLISHCDSPKESNRKCWRNISELCETKVFFQNDPFLVSVVFDAKMKEGILKIQEEAFDHQMVVGNASYGEEIIAWANTHKDALPSDQDEKVATVKKIAESDPRFKRLLAYLETDILGAYQEATNKEKAHAASKRPWEFERKRSSEYSKEARETHLKRGMVKRLLVGDILSKDNTVDKANGKWLSFLGLVKPSVSKYQVCDEELRWFLASPYAKDYKTFATLCCTDGFIKQITKVRNLSLMSIYNDYVISHYQELITVKGMKALINNLRANPEYGIEIPEGVEIPTNIWIYDVVASLVKAKTGKNQGFGYSFFNMHPASEDAMIGSMTVGSWCARFAGEFFNRKNLAVQESAINLMATVLSEKLAEIPVKEIVSLNGAMQDKYRDSEYEATLLSHRGFTPLQELLIQNHVATRDQTKVNIRTCFAEKAGAEGQTGKVGVVHVGNTIIMCKSATKNPHDKRKELCGQAVGLRYCWDSQQGAFLPRGGVKKLVMFLDGLWSQEDIDALINAGWDEIYYPDEIDQLKAAIV